MGCSTGGLEAQPLWDMFLNPASSLQLVWSPNWLIRGLRAPSAGCWLSLQHLSKWSGLQTALSYIIVQHPPSCCGRHNFALIQPVHGQGYNILIDRMHLLFTLVHFLFWQLGRVVGQYTTSLLVALGYSHQLYFTYLVFNVIYLFIILFSFVIFFAWGKEK